MEFRELWALVVDYIHHTLKTCCFKECNAEIKDILHRYTTNTEVGVYLRCANDHYEWYDINIQKLYERYNDKLIELEKQQQQEGIVLETSVV
jgi:hypothetical protein